MKLSKILLQVVSTTLVAATAFSAGFLFNEASKVNEAREEREARRQLVTAPPTEVALLRLEPRAYRERLACTGKVRAWRSATLAFAEMGIIASYCVEKGDAVCGPRGDEPGTVLAALDPVRFEANARAANAQLEKSRWEREQTESLFRQGSASEEELKAVNLLCALNETQLAQAEKILRDATLRAPFTGVIAERFIEAGEAASPQSPAFRLIQMDRVKVVVSVPSRRINEVQVGQKAEVVVETRIGETVRLPGTVYNVPPAAAGQLFEVEISVDNEGGVLREGMIARASIHTRVSPGVFVLPLETVIQIGGLRKVMLVEKGGKVTDGFFDLALLPRRIQERLSDRRWDRTRKAWHDLPRSEWDGLELTPVEKLKARVHAPGRGVPPAETLRGPGIRVFHVGDLARERVLRESRIEGDLCLVPDDGTLRAGDILIARGQHRVSDGGAVVESVRNELSLPEAGERP